MIAGMRGWNETLTISLHFAICRAMIRKSTRCWHTSQFGFNTEARPDARVRGLAG